MEETASVENEVVHSNFAPETGESTPPKTTDRQASNKVVQPPEATELAESDSMLNQNGSGFTADLENGSPIDKRRVNRRRSSVKWRRLVSASSTLISFIALAISIIAIFIFALANTTKQQTMTKENQAMGEPGRFTIDLSRQRFCSQTPTLSEMPCQFGSQLITGIHQALPLRLKKKVDDFKLLYDASSIIIIHPGLYSLSLKVHLKVKVAAQVVTMITIDEKREQVCLSQSSQTNEILDCTIETKVRLNSGKVVKVEIVNADVAVLAESHITSFTLHRLKD